MKMNSAGNDREFKDEVGDYMLHTQKYKQLYK